MEVFKTIKKRRSIRAFTERNVTKKDIEKIIKAGLYAPSSKNCQPWHFIVLKGRDKDKIAEITEKNFIQPSWYPTKQSSVLESCNVIRQASVLILVFNKYPRSGGEKTAKNTELISAVIAETLSIGACIENMLLTATSLGLGSLWIGDLRNAKPFVERHVKTKYDLIAGVAIGYSAYKSKPKKIQPFTL